MNKHTTRGLLLIVAGAVLVLAALTVHSLQNREDQLAGQNSVVLLDGFEQSLDRHLPVLMPDDPATDGTDTPSNRVQMPVATYSGYDMVGKLSVPSVGIELPILAEWSYELLRAAPCRYSGSAAGNDLILLGHNYKSHLQPLYNVAVGDTVTFTDASGVVYEYRVAALETLHQSEGEKLSSEYDLSVFTCTWSGTSRLVVRCQRVN